MSLGSQSLPVILLPPGLSMAACRCCFLILPQLEGGRLASESSDRLTMFRLEVDEMDELHFQIEKRDPAATQRYENPFTTSA